MHTNKINFADKKINKEGIIYTLIFVLYITIAVLIFVYAINSLRAVINTALSTPDSTEVENKYGQLDLENYSLVAGKLGLKKVNQTITPPVEAPIETSTESQIATTSLPEIVVPTTTPEIEPVVEAPKIEEKKPTIIITNSTLTSGLAAALKNKLNAANYEVLSTGNNRPALEVTTIKIKNSISPDSTYLAEIKKIVDLNYDFVILTLNETAKSDIEIIIGNK